MTPRFISRTALAVVFVAAVASPAAAQVDVGVKGGLNLNTTAIGPLLSPNAKSVNRIDFGGGLFIVVAPDAKVGAMMEALYSRRGGRVTDNSLTPPLHEDLIFQYFDVNGMLMIRVAKTSNGNVHLFVGPSVGFKLKAQLSISDGTTEDLSEQFKTTDVALVAGAGAKFGRLVIDGRYVYGFTSVLADPAFTNNVVGPTTFKHRTISFMVGVVF